ncbi:MAG: metal-dependent hydrolase [Bdellovibrionales bacterium]|jgi:inner membrane protein|nr:metal-dependent hydrolase [Bdellovibrionales bacterium]
MDPVTQGVLGGVTAQSFSRRNLMPQALLAGILGGMAADLDVLIRSTEDPLLALEFHRHFTHSLVFIPFGGALVGFLIYALVLLKRRLKGDAHSGSDDTPWSLKPLVLFAIAGYATHALLDSCTSYGTQLLWPLSNTRFAWNNIGIIDPIPTFIWIAGAVAAHRLSRKDDRHATPRLQPRAVAAIALLLGLSYLGFGLLQRERAVLAQQEILKSRGHHAVRASVKPTIFQTLVWRSIYEYDGRFYSDGISIGYIPELLGGRKATVYEGSSIEKFDITRFTNDLTGETNVPSKASTLLTDIKRFMWFSDDWVSVHPRVGDTSVNAPAATGTPELSSIGMIVLGDVRYSMLPQEIDPMWGIVFDPNRPNDHVGFESFRNPTSRQFGTLWKMILGEPIQQDVADSKPQGMLPFLSLKSKTVYPPNNSYSDIGVLEAVLLMAEVKGLFDSATNRDIANLGYRFAWDFRWDVPQIGAGSNLLGDVFNIMLYGGYVRAEKMTPLILELTLCHEFGHLLGGDPRQNFPQNNDEHWSSTEGQSDWWAATVCLPKLYSARGLSPEETQERIKQAALEFTVFARFHFYPDLPEVSLNASAPERPATTPRLSYPSLQCRLDTFRIGADCPECERPPCWWVPVPPPGQ